MTSKKVTLTLLLATIPLTAAIAVTVHPVVDVQSGYLLGSSRGKKWIDAKATAAQMKGRKTYRLFDSEHRSSTGVGSKPYPGDFACPYTRYADIKPKNGVIAVAGKWKVMPRVPQVLSNNSPFYRKIVADILKKHSIKPNVRITRIMRVDLEGDGTQEVLISATKPLALDRVRPSLRENGYSILFLCKSVGGKVVTQTLGEYYSTETSATLDIFTIAGAWDLNGDGRMEIVISRRACIGRWNDFFYKSTTVYEMHNNRAVKVLGAECGH